MNNQQYSSGERNHYFYGKLMTVRDFESEQGYFNDKRRLGNRMLHGAGIVSGLGVLLMDNQTFSLEAGMALDYLGREIVVSEPCVKHLSVIKGFDDIRENGAVYLGIAYKEELKEVTFSVASSGKNSGVSQEFNRVQEGYELFLTTRAPNPANLGVDNILYDLCPVYDDGSVSISLQIPKFVNTDNRFFATVIFEKRNVAAPVHFSFLIKSDLFKGDSGEKSVRVEYAETEVSTYKKFTLDYSMECGSVSDDFADITIPKESFALSFGSKKGGTLEKDITRPVEVTARPLRDVVTEAYYACHFDELLSAREDQAIYLAKFHLITNQSTYFIEKIERNPFHQYLPSSQLLSLLQTIEKASVHKEATQEPLPQVTESNAVRPSGTPSQVITGVESINLGVAPKVGRNYYSHEFIHGLGAGNVCVIVAVENSGGQGTGDTLIFGGENLFPSGEFSLAAPSAVAGAMVNARKGTLQLGIRLLEKTSQQILKVRWWAFMPSNEQAGGNENIADGFIRVVVQPNTANLEPLQQIRFSATIEGTSSQEVNWSVVEKNGGTIDRNGLYTAPTVEGVFEIQAQSVKYGMYKASAYVVVGKE